MDLKVTYNPINERNIFTNGDIVTGQVTLQVRESCQMNPLSITFEVESEVDWDSDYDPEITTYHSEEKRLKVNHFLVHGNNLKGCAEVLTSNGQTIYSGVVTPGCYVCPFSFQIPFQDLPASYHSSFGNIKYKLTAKLSRSMKRDKTHATEITFVPRQNLTNNLMMPQHMTVDKKMKLFNSGKISMDVKLEKSGFCRGEQLKVLAYIVNNSSREIKPKYCLYRQESYFTKHDRRVRTKNLLKEVGEPIPRSTSQNVKKVITIPRDAGISILNCPNIRVEYKLRVYLDVVFASDPKVKFPIIILPTPQVPAVSPRPGVSDFGFGAFRSARPLTRGLVPPAPLVVDLPPPYE